MGSINERGLNFFTNISKLTNNNELQKKKITQKFSVSYYDEKTSKVIRTEEKTAEYDVNTSLFDDNNVVNYLGNSPLNDYDIKISNIAAESDISLNRIINWSNNHKSMLLKPAHFAYLKNFGTYPANRLMILRRYDNAIDHNIFKVSKTPIATMCSYYTLDESPVKISFNENWKLFDSSFYDVLQNVIGIQFDTIPGLGKIIGAASGSNLGQDMMQKIGESMGIISPGGMTYGDPNIIYEASIRDVSGEETQSGLTSNVSLDFESTYIMREFNAIDGKFAMLNIIAEAIKMGTSPERFYITGGAAANLNNFIKQMQKGDVTGLFKSIIDTVTGFINKAINALEVVVDKAKAALKGDIETKELLSGFTNSLLSIGSSILKQRYNRYKWQLRGAVAALSGMKTAPWHITLGNPQAPWFMCGNMLVESVELNAGGELAYNDMFTELTVKITLKSGRSMGAHELSQLFNSGTGRIYDKPEEIIKLSIPDGVTTKIAGNPTNITTNTTGSNQATNTNTTVASNDNANNTNQSSFATNPQEDKNINPKI